MKKFLKILLFIIYISVFLFHCLRARLFGLNMSIYDYFLEFSNLIPFHSIIGTFQSYLSGYLNLDIFIKNIVGNLIYFMPFVYFLYPVVKEKKHIYLVCLSLIVGFEVCQILFKSGSFDVDDIILNFLGVVIAKFIYDQFIKWKSSRMKPVDIQ